MNLILIPLIVSAFALGLLAVTAGVGSLLTLNSTSADHGRAIRRRGGNAAVAALVFAWAGLMFAAVVGMLAGDRAAVAVLWGSGPLGWIVGLAWPSGMRDNADRLPPQDHAEPGATHQTRTNPR